MHKLVEVSLGGKLNLAPIMQNPQRILDIGTGTGIWAMEMGTSPTHSGNMKHSLVPVDGKPDAWICDRGQIP